jgi:two-component system cell cycle sensor histidine kinase/response regulator CckA
MDITEQHLAREQAAEAAALLRIAGRVARLGGWTIQLPSRELTWSDENCLIHDRPPGYKPTLDEGLGYYPEEHRPEVLRHMAACERDGTPYDFELPKTTATGRRIWVRSIGEAVRDADGKIVGLQGAFQDITTRRQAEDALRVSEAEFRTLAESMPQMVWMTRADGWNIYFNQRWVDYTGLSLEDSYGHGWNTPFHPDDRQRAWEAWQQAVAGGDYNAECRLRGADGSYRWMLVRGLPLRDRDGHTVKWLGTCTDIDDLKQAQAAALRNEQAQRALAADLEAERARLIAAQAVASIGSWETDLTTMTAIWSAETHRICETSPDQFPPTHAGFLELVHPDDRVRLEEAFVGSLERGSSGAAEHRLVMPDGRIKFVEERWQVVRNEAGQPARAIGTCQDVTGHKQLEQQYLRAQRMESIGTLASGIAHDLNNVLAPILLSIGLLHEDERDADRLETLATIEASAKRGAEMVGRLLSFARGADGRRAEVQVPLLVRELATIVRETFPKNITFEGHLGPDLWPMQADATQLHQVLLNLCVNARDAMPAGGRLTLTATNVVFDEADAALNIDARPGPYVAIGITDTGTGIPADIIDKIFDPFFTTKEMGKGTGLGLATSLAIVTGHKGFIRVNSDPGTGARFQLYLPAEPRLTKRPPPAAAVNRPRGQGETVLVVDDENAIRQIAKRTLEAFGYRVLLARDGAEAVALYLQRQSDIAVVLTDMMMPLMDGTATIQELVRLNPEVRIIGSSGLVTDASTAGPASARVLQFLPKPFTTETLLTAVKAALA